MMCFGVSVFSLIISSSYTYVSWLKGSCEIELNNKKETVKLQNKLKNILLFTQLHLEELWKVYEVFKSFLNIRPI